MRTKSIYLWLFCLLPIISMGQGQYYILYNQTINSVIGHRSSDLEGGLNFTAGIGYRHFFNNTYSMGGDLRIATSKLSEQGVVRQAMDRFLDYTNELNFVRVDIPFSIQIHYPRWYYGFGLGGSVLINSSQKQTFISRDQDPVETIVKDFDSFPTIEAFVQFTSGVRILPQLDLNLHYYQGINDIGYQYGWKKNVRVGLGLTYSLSPPPSLKRRGLFTSGEREIPAEIFRITERRNIIRHNVRKVSDHPDQVNINITSIGAGDSRILNVDLNSSSGEPSVSGTRANIQRPDFPLYLNITYVTMDSFGNNPFECVFRIEIYEPGNWEIVLQQ